MKNEWILKTLDSVDEFMLQNANQEGKLAESENVFARMHLEKLQRIRDELDKRGVEGFIKDRLEKTENAILYSMNRVKLFRNNQYFLWLNSVRQNKNISEPDYDQLFYEITTGHVSAFRPSYVQEYFRNRGIDIKTIELVLNLENIQQEYEKFAMQDEQEHQEQVEETMLAVRKRGPIQRLFDKIFQKKEQKEATQPKRKPRDLHDNQSQGHRKFCDDLKSAEPVEDYEQELKSLQQPEETIVISDLHGNMNRWEQVKKSMKQNPNMKVIILGDAMDRGESGLEILLQIKELSDKGKVEYLPGNHDIFAYNYVRTQEMLQASRENQRVIHVLARETQHLEHNGGETTIDSLKNFDTIVQNEIRRGNLKNTISKNELIAWLGSQPIQKKISINGIDYALAHAYFDNDLYNYDKDFNLEKGLQLELDGKSENDILNKFRTAMWYRESDFRTQYAPLTFPEGYLMVVGHTPQKEVNLDNFKTNMNHQVIYVDTGNGKFQGFNLSKACSLDFEDQSVR